MSSEVFLFQAGVYDEFLGKLRAQMEKELKIGDGMKDGVTQGPLVNKRQFERVVELVDEAMSKGAKCTYGGKK